MSVVVVVAAEQMESEIIDKLCRLHVGIALHNTTIKPDSDWLTELYGDTL